jgi:hypothetical protein
MRSMQEHGHRTRRPGYAVIAGDGKRLGTVKETSGSYFKVDAPFHRDYWLSSELIREEVESGVVLELNGREVGEYRLPEPGLEPEEDPFRHIAMKPVIDDAELREQRERMEEGLTEQNRHLRERDA